MKTNIAFKVTNDEHLQLIEDLKKSSNEDPGQGIQCDSCIEPGLTTNTGSSHWFLYLVDDDFFVKFPKWECSENPIKVARLAAKNKVLPKKGSGMQIDSQSSGTSWMAN